MKKILILLFITNLYSCQQEKEVTIENINQIYGTKDFSIEFNMSADDVIRMSFREDYMTYVINNETDRITIEYDQVLLINEFVGEQFNNHDASRDPLPNIVVYDDTRKVTLQVPQYASKLRMLINQLGI